MSTVRTDAASVREALALLGLQGPVDARALKDTFRAAVKSARPDQPGGDAERFRRIIAAYRLLQSSTAVCPALEAPAEVAPSAPLLSITPLQALQGAVIDLKLGGRTLHVMMPPGLRTGEHVRLRNGASDGADIYLPVLIRPDAGMSVMGDDMFMTWPVSPRVLEDGGRVEVETHAGQRTAWVTPGLYQPDNPAPVTLRLRGLGLPERAGRPAGHLFVRLDPSQDVPSSAEDLLLRFTRVWTPDHLAA